MPSFRDRAIAERPRCPRCGMNMIITGDFHLDQKNQTFECLRCGHIGRPNRQSQAAE
jgi:predicted RNA-binding Zn-ribbon protein involved in translation (DUF1610 family)